MNTLIVAGSMVLVAIVGTAIIKFLEKKEAEVVKRVFRLYLEGNGLTKIAQILTKDGVPVPRRIKRYR